MDDRVEIWFRAGKRINVKLTEEEYAGLSNLDPEAYAKATKKIRHDARGAVEQMTGLVICRLIDTEFTVQANG